MKLLWKNINNSDRMIIYELEERTYVMKEQRSKNKALKIFAIIGVIVAVAGAVIALYRYFKPDYLEDYEDDFEDEFEDDFDEE